MTKQEADFIGSMNMCDEISNEAYKKIMCNCEVEESQPCEDCISREALLKNLEEPMNWTDSEAEIQEQRDYEGFIELVKSMPSVTPSFEEWLSSFNTESATCCFTAVQELQEQCGSYECGCWIDWED